MLELVDIFAHHKPGDDTFPSMKVLLEPVEGMKYQSGFGFGDC